MRIKKRMRFHAFRVLTASLLLASLLSGCGIPFIGGGEAEKPAADAGKPEAENIAVVTGEEDARIKTLIADYFSSLYSEPVQNYYSYAVTGKIPEKLKGFISENTVRLAEGNSEIGIHLPRFVEINGLVCIEYEPVMGKSAGDEEAADITAELAGRAGEDYLYYTKVNLYAKCIAASDFESLYTMNTSDLSWKKNDGSPVSADLVDTIRIQARYDVQVRKEEGNYKVDSVREAVTTGGSGSRLLLYNNDYMKRLSYLDCTLDKDGKSYVNEADGKVYEAEKAVITSFFSSLKNSLDQEDMSLLQSAWDKNGADFRTFLDKVSQAGDGEGKKFIELMDIRDDYKTRFDYRSLPVQLNMERLEGDFTGMEIAPHPGYSDKNKIYTVTFDVPVIKSNGTVYGDECVYRYDYYVMLSGSGDTVKVSGIRLNEFSEVNTGKT